MLNLTSIFGLGDQEFVLISCFLIFAAFYIWSIGHILLSNDLEPLAKLVWLAAVFFFLVIGTLIYLYYGRTSKNLSRGR